jgi:cell wall-associated NlpC family hydrolase
MLRRSHSPFRVGRSVTGSQRRRRLAIALTLAFVLVSLIANVAPAAATTQGDINSLNAQAQHIEAQIEANNNRADILDEQYLEAQSAVQQAQSQIAAAEAGIAKAEANAAALRNRLSGRAAMLYMGAGSVDIFPTDLTNVRDLGSRAKYGEAAADTDNRLLSDLTLAEEQLGIQQKALEKQKADAQKREHDAESARQQLARTVAQQQQLLSSIKGAIKTKVDQLAAERAAAAEAAARAAFRARVLAAQQAAQQAAPTQFSSGSSNDIGTSPGNLPAPSGGAAAAIAYARSKLGDPYVYAGTGPDSFDCSGLTMMAWAAGGVSMSHNAAAQYQEFPYVPINDLQPGDLVFFGNPIHHVGLYVGGGTMIEAPHTGAVVRYSSIGRPDYAGAARP